MKVCTKQAFGGSISSMIRYDGHECIHEFLNNKKGSALETVRVVNSRLRLADSVCFEASFLNLQMLSSGFVEELHKDHPNIEHVLVYRSRKEYLNPNYASTQAIDSFNKWKTTITDLPIEVEFVDMYVEKEPTMPRIAWSLAFHHIRNLFWCRDGEEHLYFETDKFNPSFYYRLFKVLHSYNKLYRIDEFHDMITKELVDYPKVKDTISRELDYER